ncbi:MAG: MmgE/PrpD family protein [Acetobacteraceae bacterium]
MAPRWPVCSRTRTAFWATPRSVRWIGCRGAWARRGLTEIDDIHLPSCTTPGSVVVMTALTAATATGRLQVQDFAAALRAGYGAMTWLSGLVAGAQVFYRGIWPTYYATPVAAAAATARLLGLDAGQIADALAIALTVSSPGIGAPDGLSPRWLVIGEAARAGCLAALAAANGYAGDRSLLDGDWTARVHGLAIDARAAVSSAARWRGLGSQHEADLRRPANPGSDRGLPPFAAGRHRARGYRAGRSCRAAELRRPHQPRRTGTRMGRITSMGYLLGLAAYRRDALEDVARATLESAPPFQALMQAVTVVPDPALDAYYPPQLARAGHALAPDWAVRDAYDHRRAGRPGGAPRGCGAAG